MFILTPTSQSQTACFVHRSRGWGGGGAGGREGELRRIRWQAIEARDGERKGGREGRREGGERREGRGGSYKEDVDKVARHWNQPSIGGVMNLHNGS